MRVRFNRGALTDLDEIFSYIAKDNPTAAAELVDRLEEVTALLGHSPSIGQKTKRPGLFKHPVGKHLIVYEVRADEVIIHYVRYGGRLRPWEGE